MMTARSSGLGTAVEPWAWTCWAMTPRFLVRTTTLSRPMVSFESLVKSLSETSSARASECSMIMSRLFARKVRKNRHGDHAGRSDGKVADAPVGHVAAQQGHLVAGLQAGSRKDFLHLGNTTVHLGVSHVVAFEHRKCDFRRELFHAVASQFVKCIDGHNFSFSTTSE